MARFLSSRFRNCHYTRIGIGLMIAISLVLLVQLDGQPYQPLTFENQVVQPESLSVPVAENASTSMRWLQEFDEIMDSFSETDRMAVTQIMRLIELSGTMLVFAENREALLALAHLPAGEMVVQWKELLETNGFLFERATAQLDWFDYTVQLYGPSELLSFLEQHTTEELIYLGYCAALTAIGQVADGGGVESSIGIAFDKLTDLLYDDKWDDLPVEYDHPMVLLGKCPLPGTPGCPQLVDLFAEYDRLMDSLSPTQQGEVLPWLRATLLEDELDELCWLKWDEQEVVEAINTGRNPPDRLKHWVGWGGIREWTEIVDSLERYSRDELRNMSELAAARAAELCQEWPPELLQTARQLVVVIQGCCAVAFSERNPIYGFQLADLP